VSADLNAPGYTQWRLIRIEDAPWPSRWAVLLSALLWAMFAVAAWFVSEIR